MSCSQPKFSVLPFNFLMYLKIPLNNSNIYIPYETVSIVLCFSLVSPYVLDTLKIYCQTLV